MIKRSRSYKWDFMRERQEILKYHHHVGSSMHLTGLVYSDLFGTKFLWKTEESQRKGKDYDKLHRVMIN